MGMRKCPVLSKALCAPPAPHLKPQSGHSKEAISSSLKCGISTSSMVVVPCHQANSHVRSIPAANMRSTPMCSEEACEYWPTQS